MYAYALPTAKPVAADPLAGLDDLARQVKASGITAVSGDVLVNDKLWDLYQTKEGVVTSIMVNDNLLTSWSPRAPRRGIRCGSTPGRRRRTSTSSTTAPPAPPAGSRRWSRHLGANNRIVVTGSLPLGSPQQDLAVFAPSPADYARALFIEALRRAG